MKWKIGFIGVLACNLASAVTLENENLAIHFSEAGSGFAITSIVNKVAGAARFVKSDLKKPDFWQVEFVKGTSFGPAAPLEKVMLQNHTPSHVRRWEQIKDGLAFIWEGLKLPDGTWLNCSVRAEVRLKPGALDSEWSLAIDNRSAHWALWETAYPYLRGIVESGEADVLIPSKNQGARLIRACNPDKDAVGTWGYPGWYPMVAAYLKGEAGLMLMAADGEARIKSLQLGKGASAAFITPCENAGVLGKAAEGPRYVVRIGAFKGDWWQVAKRYRAWALKQSWAAKGRIIDRADYPRVMADTPLWILENRNSATDMSNILVRAKARWPDVKLALHWYGWNEEPFDTYYPEYCPRRGVRETSEWARAQDILVMPYINGRIWDDQTASFAFGRSGVCTKANGALQLEDYNRRRFGVMCPTDAAWQNVIRRNVTNMIEGCHCSAIYCDQIACSRPQLCFNPAHGHALGGGTWWAEGYRRALEPIHTRLSKMNAPITSEGMAETWLGEIDGYLNCELPLADDVPFYMAVYSGYATYFGMRVNPPNGEDVFFAMQVRALLWGIVPGWNGTWMLRGWKECAEHLHKVARVRAATLDYLAYGTLEDEWRPISPVPTMPLSWVQLRRHKVTQKVDYKAPVVMGSVWKNAAQNRTAIFLANISKEAQKVTFKVPAPCKAPLRPRAIQGLEAPQISTDAKGLCTLTLAPRQITVLE